MFLLVWLLDYEEIDITKGYVVWNPLCRIPRFDPFDNSIKEYIIPVEKPKICSHLDPLTTVEFNFSTQRHTLKVNSNVVHKYWTAISSLRCCYMEISRNRKSEDDIYDTKYKSVCWACELKKSFSEINFSDNL